VTPGAAPEATRTTPVGGPVSPDVTGVSDQAVRLVRVQHAMKAATARARPDRAALSLLFPLHDRGPLRAGALAEALHADPSTISRHVAALQSAGLVRREADPVDGRASLLAITETGRATCTALRGQRDSLVGELLADWDAEDVASLHRLLRRLNDAFEAAVPTLSERMAAVSPTPPEGTTQEGHRP
jgi:DNA-binding MarR family transcriptional regulator